MFVCWQRVIDKTRQGSRIKLEAGNENDVVLQALFQF